MPEANERRSGSVTDVHARAVSTTAILVLVVIGIVLGVCHWLLGTWHAYANAGNRPLDAPPMAPMLESAPQDDRARYTAEKEKLLQSYGWIDRQRGIARIPIDRAMAVLAARNAAVREGAQQR